LWGNQNTFFDSFFDAGADVLIDPRKKGTKKKGDRCYSAVIVPHANMASLLTNNAETVSA
jgi:hypothetical protein